MALAAERSMIDTVAGSREWMGDGRVTPMKGGMLEPETHDSPGDLCLSGHHPVPLALARPWSRKGTSSTNNRTAPITAAGTRYHGHAPRRSSGVGLGGLALRYM